MCWLKREIWKAGIAVASMLLLLVLLVWIPVSAVGAHEGASELATPVTGTVQATPTEDVTVTALSKEQLTLQVKQLQDQLQNQNSWLVNNSTALIAAVASVVVALFGIFQWAITVRQAKDKDLKDRAEERFKTAVTALGDEKEGTQVGGAILLRSFLNKDDKGYERYYPQIFDLAVAYLCLPRTSHSSEDPDGIPHSPDDPNAPLPLTPLRKALIVVFKEALPLARRQVSGPNPPFVRGIQSLDATGIQLDNAYLRRADLEQVRMPEASLRKANLKGATLSGADLFKAKLCEASLTGADLSNASLIRANLFKTWFRQANLSEADLSEADLTGANFNEANLSRAMLNKVNLEDALSLKDTNLRSVKGLTKEQLEACKAKGAIIDEDSATSPPQSPVSPPSPSQSNDVQVPSAPPAQVNTPTLDTDGSSTTSSKPSNNAQAPSPAPAQGSAPTPGTDGSSTTSSKPSNNAQEQSATPAQGSPSTSDTGGNSAASSQQDPKS